jgi:transcriptional regulatory protein RtcR
VEAEIERLKATWHRPGETAGMAAPLLDEVLTSKQRASLDPFDAVQLDYVLSVCRQSTTLSDAGRKLFAFSRAKKAKTNDADRLKKYLARFELDWSKVRAR